MPFSASEIESYRERLQAQASEIETLRHRLDEIAVETAAEDVENVQLAGARDMAISDLDREATLVREIREALHRVSDGTYGICLNCLRDIARGRLNAVPWAAYCIRCQVAIDDQKGAPRDVETDPRDLEAA
jgi:DnaK suppressor protein